MSYADRRRTEELEGYRFEVLVYLLQRPYVKGDMAKPGLPGILKEPPKNG